MTSTDVLAMYEQLAGLTSQKVRAARAKDWDGLDDLEQQCAAHVATAADGVPALTGASRLRKIDLLKQIMANDRAMRDITEPWMANLNHMMHGASASA